MESNNQNLNEFQEKNKKIANLLVLFNITRNKKLALLALEELENTSKKMISFLLRYENSIKRFKLSKDPEINMRNFENISQKNYELLKKETNLIKEILEISKIHKNSTMEFTRNEEIVIIGKNQTIKKLSQQKLSESLTILEKLLKNLNLKIKG